MTRRDLAALAAMMTFIVVCCGCITLAFAYALTPGAHVPAWLWVPVVATAVPYQAAVLVAMRRRKLPPPAGGRDPGGPSAP